MHSLKINTGGLLLSTLILFTACKKATQFLDDKPVSSLYVPTTTPEVQSLLDQSALLNEGTQSADMLADNYCIDSSIWRGINPIDRNLHTWAADIYEGQGAVKEWDQPYKQVLCANVSMDALDHITSPESQNDWNSLYGAALFIRGNALFSVAGLYALPYNEATADSDLGIPLRMGTDINEATPRRTLRATYAQILDDLMRSVKLLPTLPNTANPNRPSKVAACALLSRIYLFMRNYTQAGAWADSCLRLYDKLLDYNDLRPATFPFTATNPELLYSVRVQSTNLLVALLSRSTLIAPALYQSYSIDDLRDSIYYSLNANGKRIIRTSYSGSVYPFQGLAVDEVLLTRAECRARAGNSTEAQKDLKRLLSCRYKRGSIMPTSSPLALTDLLQLILQERRKELPFRGTRWLDIRRLNKEGADIKLTRTQGGVTYELPPNDLRAVLPIPPDVIALSGMVQNPR